MGSWKEIFKSFKQEWRILTLLGIAMFFMNYLCTFIYYNFSNQSRLPNSNKKEIESIKKDIRDIKFILSEYVSKIKGD